MSASETRVADVMSAPAVSLRDYDSLRHAVDRFTGSGLRHLVVLDADGRLVGLLDDRQLLVHGTALPVQGSRRTVGQLVRPMPPGRAAARQVPPAASLAEASRMMARLAVDALPVVDSAGTVVGVLTASDVIRGTAAATTALATQP